MTNLPLGLLLFWGAANSSGVKRPGPPPKFLMPSWGNASPVVRRLACARRANMVWYPVLPKFLGAPCACFFLRARRWPRRMPWRPVVGHFSFCARVSVRKGHQWETAHVVSFPIKLQSRIRTCDVGCSATSSDTCVTWQFNALCNSMLFNDGIQCWDLVWCAFS